MINKAGLIIKLQHLRVKLTGALTYKVLTPVLNIRTRLFWRILRKLNKVIKIDFPKFFL